MTLFSKLGHELLDVLLEQVLFDQGLQAVAVTVEFEQI
jgi:hypothetical protein